MNPLRNKIHLIGNLDSAPVIEVIENRKKASLILNTNDTYRDARGNKINKQQQFKLSAWGRTADIVEKFLTRGSEIAIEGLVVNEKKEVFIEIGELLMLGVHEK